MGDNVSTSTTTDRSLVALDNLEETVLPPGGAEVQQTLGAIWFIIALVQGTLTVQPQ
jgi:hypothetical protein